MGMADMFLDMLPPEFKDGMAALTDPTKRAELLAPIVGPLIAMSEEQGRIRARLDAVEDRQNLIIETLRRIEPACYDEAYAALGFNTAEEIEHQPEDAPHAS